MLVFNLGTLEEGGPCDRVEARGRAPGEGGEGG